MDFGFCRSAREEHKEIGNFSDLKKTNKQTNRLFTRQKHFSKANSGSRVSAEFVSVARVLTVMMSCTSGDGGIIPKQLSQITEIQHFFGAKTTI